MCKLSQCDASAFYVALLWLMSPTKYPCLVWFGSSQKPCRVGTLCLGLAFTVAVGHKLQICSVWSQFLKKLGGVLRPPARQRSAGGSARFFQKIFLRLILKWSFLILNCWITFGWPLVLCTFENTWIRGVPTHVPICFHLICVLLCFWKLLTLLSSAYTPRGTFLYDF